MSKAAQKAIGGQAVMEGVMVKCGRTTAMAVRRKDGSITTELREDTSIAQRFPFLKWPILRGCVNLIEQLRIGYVMLMKSANYMEEDELAEAGEEKPSKAATAATGGIALFFVLVLMIGLFFLLPTLIAGWVAPGTGSGMVAMESVARLLIFIGYLVLVGLMPDMKRIFMYHGAEHKALYCYQNGEAATAENAQKYSRLHPRCGTTYLFLVMIVSILVFSLLGVQGSPVVRVLVRIALLPLVAGIAYELLRFFAKYDNLLARIIRAPGLALQYLTTREPTPDMLEVATVAIRTADEAENAREGQ